MSVGPESSKSLAPVQTQTEMPLNYTQGTTAAGVTGAAYTKMP